MQVILFILGLIFGGFVLVKNNINLRDFLIFLTAVLATSLIIFVFFGDNYPQTFVILFLLIFLIPFFMAFKEVIINEINELILLSFNLTFWYLFLTKINPNPVLILLASLPTIGVIFLAFSNFKIKDHWKIVFYLWFLVMDAFLILFYFFYGDLSSLVLVREIDSISLFNSFLAGMAFLHLSSHFLCFASLIRLSTEYNNRFVFEPIKKTIKDTVRNSRFIIDKYSSKQAKILHSFLLVLLQGGFLILNYFYSFIPEFLLISIFVIVVPQLLIRNNSSVIVEKTV